MIENTETQGPALFLVMGLPKTGKTTTATELAAMLGAPVVSATQLLRAITGGIEPAQAARKCQELAQDVVGWYLVSGQPVIYDAMNLNRANRRPLLEIARALGVPAFGVWTACQGPVQRERLEREQFPLDLAVKLAQHWEPPSPDEGFQLITTVFSDPSPGQELESQEVP